MAETKSEEGHGLYSGEHPPHGKEQTAGDHRAEVLEDREWMFAAFMRWSAWALVLILLIMIFLALTQT